MAIDSQSFEHALQVHQAGDLKHAQELYRQILREDPHNALVLRMMGVVAQQEGHLDLAIEYIRHALQIEPSFPEAHNSLGIVLAKANRLDEAIACWRQAVHFAPSYAGAHSNLGKALQAQGKLDEAAVCFESAVHLDPDATDDRCNLGKIYLDQRRLDEAVACLRQATGTGSAHALLARTLLAYALYDQGNIDEAETVCREVLQLNPSDVFACSKLAGVLKDQGRIEDAVDCLRRAVAAAPDSSQTHSALLYLLTFDPRCDAAAIYEETCRWRQHFADPLGKFIQPHANRPDPERRLRVGYVSGDFRRSVVSFFTLPALANHDHERFEVFLYLNSARPDEDTDEFCRHADAWHDVRRMSDEDLAERVRADGIDILVDVSLHTGDNRLLALARKPAPVQVTWLGINGSTGLTTIDYRLTDAYLDPPGLDDAYYSEKCWRLPETYWVYDPRTAEPAVNALPALENGRVTFGCLNQFSKINDTLLGVWAQVLRGVPNASLLLLAPQGVARERCRSVLSRHGAGPACVEFVDRRPRLDYFRLYHRIDLCLDTFPFNSHTTGLDAFWMGVPTITLRGRTLVGREGWSQLCNLGLQDLAAQSPEEYVEIARRLAGDTHRLAELRGTLRERMMHSPLMDFQGYTRNLEQAYREMWRRWCRGEAPRAGPDTAANQVKLG